MCSRGGRQQKDNFAVEMEEPEEVEEVDILRQRIRSLEEENRELRIRLSAAATNSSDGDDSPESKLEAALADADVRSAVHQVCTRLAMEAETRAERRISALEDELGRTLREKNELMLTVMTMRRTDTNQSPRSNSSRASGPSMRGDATIADLDAYDAEADQAAASALRTMSAAMRKDKRRDRRSFARSRSEKETNEVRNRVNELEDVLASLQRTASTALAKGATAGVSSFSSSYASSFTEFLSPSFHSSSPEGEKSTVQPARVPILKGGRFKPQRRASAA